MYRWKNYREWSIKRKLLVFSALFILGSVYLESILSYSKYTKDFEVQSSDRVGQIIEQVSYNIDTYLDDLFRLSLSPYMNDSVMKAIEDNAKNSEYELLQKRRTIEGYLEEMMIYPRKDINRVFILTDDVYTSGRIPISVDTKSRFQEFDWYKQAMTTQDSIFVPTHIQQMVKNQGPKVFSIVKQLRSTRNTEKILGVIKVDANYKGIEIICDKVNLGIDGGLFIIDEKHNVIYGNTKNLNAQKFYEAIQESGKNMLSIQDNNTPYLLNATLLPRSNWTILAVSSLTELNHKAKETRNFGFWMALVCSALAFILLYWFIRKLLAPLLTIVHLMKEVEQSNLSVRFPDLRRDEIGYLGTSFNRLVARVSEMLEENTQLVKKVYETELLQKEAQVQALYNQIRPHFIFNTLNMISMLMQTGKHEKAVDHIHKLSDLMRSITMWDKEIPLQREIEILQAYLSIQSSRYEGRLDYSIQIDPALYDLLIPALLFQPVVENAVIHGCETQREKTTLRVFSETKEEELLFTIQDTGKGMSPETLALLRLKLERLEMEELLPEKPVRNGLGIGLINVNKRIKLKYGPDYGITVDSVLNEGTTVRINLPLYGPERSSCDV